VVKTEERYEPTFSYRWDLLEAWLPEAAAEGRRLARDEAVGRLIERYLAGAVFTTERLLARLFGLGREEVSRAIARLQRRGTVVGGCEVAGWPGRWIIHRDGLGAS
jgi:hypothetical protein